MDERLQKQIDFILEIDKSKNILRQTHLTHHGRRENDAEDRLFSMLPADQGQVLKALFEEFNAEQTPEAKFARVMDNFQPLLLNNSNDGMDWTSHDISASQVYGRQNRSRPGSEKLFQITDKIIKENIQKGKLK